MDRLFDHNDRFMDFEDFVVVDDDDDDKSGKGSDKGARVKEKGTRVDGDGGSWGDAGGDASSEGEDHGDVGEEGVVAVDVPHASAGARTRGVVPVAPLVAILQPFLHEPLSLPRDEDGVANDGDAHRQNIDPQRLLNNKCCSRTFDTDFQQPDDVMTGKDVLVYFIESGLHPYFEKRVYWKNQRSTIVVGIIRHSDDAEKSRHPVLIRQNTYGEHAEMKLIKYIREKVDIDKVKGITIYSNYSPCNEPLHTCSTKLQTLQNELPEGVRIKVKFCAFYYINRPSCRRCDHKETSDEESQLAFNNLQALDAMPFQKEDWENFIKLLEEYDKCNQRPSQCLRQIRNGDRYGDWRNSEDDRMMYDFKTLNERSKKTPSTPEPPRRTAEPSRPSKNYQATDRTTDGRTRRDLQEEFCRSEHK